MAGQREGNPDVFSQRAAWARVGMIVVSVLLGGGTSAQAAGAGASPTVEPATRSAATLASVPVTSMGVDQSIEVPLALPLRLPYLGPRYAPVTLDLFIAVGQKSGDVNLGLVLRRVREEPDVRVLLHPVTGGLLADRGAELVWEAFVQQPTRCFDFISQLFSHPEWLAPTADGEEALLTGATAAGLDAPRLLRALTSHRHRAVVSALWQGMRDQVRYPPEIWANGHRLRGTLNDAQLREEVDSQRTRAQRALQSGAPLTKLYERLVTEERTQRADDGSAAFGRAWGRVSLPPLPTTAAQSTPRLDLTGVPSRGPSVAPVTLAVLASIDTYGSSETLRAAHEVWSHHPDSVRLVFLQAPRSPTSRRIALILAQVALVDQRRFWRLFDNIIDILGKGLYLRTEVFDNLLKRDGTAALIESGLRTPAAENQLRHDLEEARRLGIEYTPVVLVNGQPVRGEPLVHVLEAAVERESQRGLLQRLHSPTPRADLGWLVR